jgi:lipid A 3-O-deacylase
MLRSFLAFALGLLPSLAAAQTMERESAPDARLSPAESLVNPDPLLRWEFDYECGVIRKVGGGATPLSYVVTPQLLTWKTPAAVHLSLFGGDLIMRSRYSLLLEPIVKGPEKYYVGASGSGCLEWWNIPRTTSFFFASGGGLGVMHSKGHQIAGAQGQDLNFNWLVYVGARKRWKPGLSASLGIYFQHVSNTGLDRINPGLNALGPMISFGWHH